VNEFVAGSHTCVGWGWPQPSHWRTFPLSSKTECTDTIGQDANDDHDPPGCGAGVTTFDAAELGPVPIAFVAVKSEEPLHGYEVRVATRPIVDDAARLNSVRGNCPCGASWRAKAPSNISRPSLGSDIDSSPKASRNRLNLSNLYNFLINLLLRS
jgi:hypothetical protein